MKGFFTMKAQSFLTLAAACTAFIIVTEASAQSRQIPAPPQDRPVIIHSGTVHTVSGDTIENGYVAFDGGIVTAVGRGTLPNLPNAILRDATGLHVYPGLIATSTNLGLTETGAVDVTQDINEFGDFTPEARAISAVNPDSDLIPVARANGILTAFINTSGGVISGRGAIMRLDGWTWEDLAIEPDAGLILSWPRARGGGFRFGGFRPQDPDEMQKRYQENLEKIEQFFDDAQVYVNARNNNETVKTDLRLEAMRPYVLGEKPI